MNRTYHIWTIGCQMNDADSRHLASRLEQAGHVPCADAAKADLVILNTCVVRQQAEEIKKLNAKFAEDGFRIFFGTECDILSVKGCECAIHRKVEAFLTA